MSNKNRKISPEYSPSNSFNNGEKFIQCPNNKKCNIECPRPRRNNKSQVFPFNTRNTPQQMSYPN
jgi:hypothetical protein